MTIRLQVETQEIIYRAGLLQYKAEVDKHEKFLNLVSENPDKHPDIPCYSIVFNHVNPSPREITRAANMLTNWLKAKKQEITDYIQAVKDLNKWGSHDEYPEPGVYIYADVIAVHIPNIRAVVSVNKQGEPSLANPGYEVSAFLDDQKNLIFTEQCSTPLKTKAINELRRAAYKIAKKQKRNLLNAIKYAQLKNNVEKAKNNLKQ